MRAPWEGPARVLDGKATAAAIKAELKERVDRLREAGVVPGLGTILVGEDPGSVAYVAGKHRDCAEIGAESIRVDLPADATQEQVEAAIDQLNADPACSCVASAGRSTRIDSAPICAQSRCLPAT